MPEEQADTYSSNVVPVAPEASSDLAPEVAVNPEVAEVANEDSEAKVEAKNPKPAVKVEKEVVTKAAEPKATPANDQSKTADSFTVQVGVYSDIANVKQLQEKLKQAGYTSRTEKVATPNGEKIRLRAGKFSSRQEAASALSKIQAAGLSGMVIGHE
jgi:DedD protein